MFDKAIDVVFCSSLNLILVKNFFTKIFYFILVV